MVGIVNSLNTQKHFTKKVVISFPQRNEFFFPSEFFSCLAEHLGNVTS